VAIYTIEEFASYVQSDVDTATAVLLRDLATGAIKSATGQEVDVVTDDAITLAAPDGPWLVLPQLPASEPTLVKVDGETITDWTFSVDRLYRPQGWTAYDDTTGAPLRVEVTYTHGYATAPAELKRIALQAAARAYTNPSGASSHSETIGSESYSDNYGSDARTLGVTLTAQEKREARRAVGQGGAYTLDLVPAYERPWWLT
jgi:hypothetical protein